MVLEAQKKLMDIGLTPSRRVGRSEPAVRSRPDVLSVALGQTEPVHLAVKTASAPARSQLDEPESAGLLLSELQPLTASESVRLTMVAAMIDPAMRNMSPPEMLFRKEAVRTSVDLKVTKFCE